MNHKLQTNVLWISLLALTPVTYAAEDTATAPVSGFVRSFITGTELVGVITVLETGEKIKTDAHGHFGPINYPVGKSITLQFEKWGYRTTQSATMVVPEGGLTDPLNNITFQVPETITYNLLASIIGAKIDPNSCHVATTITAWHKTMDDLPQGEENAKVSIEPYTNEVPFYFDIFKEGPLKGKTNPFSRGLTQTSEDGGLALFNVPVRDEPYVITATKNGMKFTSAQFKCTKDAFINLSPPLGPMVIK